MQQPQGAPKAAASPAPANMLLSETIEPAVVHANITTTITGIRTPKEGGCHCLRGHCDICGSHPSNCQYCVLASSAARLGTSDRHVLQLRPHSQQRMVMLTHLGFGCRELV
jgi:hypothetical protein